MLYDAYNRPIKTDPRTLEQIEFDTKLRAQMGDNGGQHFPRELIHRIKEQMVVRDVVVAHHKQQQESSRGSVMDRVVEEYDDKAKHRRSKSHSA